LSFRKPEECSAIRNATSFFLKEGFRANLEQIYKTKGIEGMGMDDSTWNFFFEALSDNSLKDYLMKVIKIGMARGEVVRQKMNCLLSLFMFYIVRNFCWNCSSKFIKILASCPLQRRT